MHPKLKSYLYTAVENALNKSVDCDDHWEYFIHDELVAQMTDAAALVFDSSQSGQKYYKENSGE